jgi:hypothetical protein
VTGTAIDNAGNSATVTATVNIDEAAPTIAYSLAPAPNSNGWNNSNVTVTFTCSDTAGGSGIASCTSPVTFSTEGASQQITGTAIDNAGNTASTTATIKLDKTAPTLGTPSWSANPVQVGSNTVLTVPSSDSLSGVVGGEYFIGPDPGVGHGTAMTYSSGNLQSAPFGSSLAVGVYTIGVRAQDAAGNWSPVVSTMLVIYDQNTTLSAVGKNKKDLIPSLANGDILPGLTSSTQTDAADYGFTVQYKNGALDSHNDFIFTYATGTHCNSPQAQNCHSFVVNATSFAWLVVNGTNNSNAQFQGVATVTVDGVTTTNAFTVSVIDGDKLNPTGNDYLLLKVYAPGADPATASSIYQASGFMPKGNSVTIK